MGMNIPLSHISSFSSGSTVAQQKERKSLTHEQREEKKTTQNSICSGLDSSFFSLKSLALNPICVFCQLCPRVPSGVMKKKKKPQMADKQGVKTGHN